MPKAPKPRTLHAAYLWWTLGLGGLLGLHRFYLRDARMGALQLLTAGGLGALAARDLLALERLVARANGEPERPRPSPWRREGLAGRWVPLMGRGRLVAIAFVVSFVLMIGAGLDFLVLVAITWAVGWWAFAIGVVLGPRLFALQARILRRWHYRLSGRSPGEPFATIEARTRDRVRVDPVPDEAYLPLAIALAAAFELSRWGPTVPLLGHVLELGVPLVPLLAGLLFPLLRAPPASHYRSARYDDQGELLSLRPLGARLTAYFGFLLVFGAILAGWLQRDAGVFSLVFSLVVPVLLGTAWYEQDRLARDVERFEAVMARAVTKGTEPRQNRPAEPRP